MRRAILPILYAVVFIAYTVSSFFMFETWNSNVVIPYIPLIALGTWLFGRSTGLLLFIPVSVIAFILSQQFGDIYIYYTDRFAGHLFFPLVILMVGRLRTNYINIRNLNVKLDRKVADRDRDLTILTNRLLKNTEKRRMQFGQNLHDGIGQQLTGIKLLCTSLQHQLEHEQNPLAQLAKRHSNDSTFIHHQIRCIARSLFPVRIATVGLISALSELAASFNEIRNMKITIREASGVGELSEDTSLQLYRICQESCTYLVEHGVASEIVIHLKPQKKKLTISIEHNGILPQEHKDDSLFELIQYRLKKITGDIAYSTTLTGRPFFYFEMPTDAGKTNYEI